MKKILSKIVALASLFVLVGFVTVSCDKKKDEPQQKKTYKELIVGSWKRINQEQNTRYVDPIERDNYIIFYADGTVVFSGDKKYKYKMDKDKIIIEDYGEYTILELNDKTLKVKTISGDVSTTSTFERVK